jgi:cytochrome oxidase assembly protein ShyY1
MLRTGKWVALTCVALLTLVGFAALSYWQWERAQRDMIANQPVVPVDQMFQASGSLPSANYGQRVEVTGTFDRTHQVLVRRDASSFVVVTPLIRASAPAVAIARGTVAWPTDPAVDLVPSGQVTISGTVQPLDGDPGGVSTLPAGQVGQLTAASIGVTPMLAAWVAQTPSQTGLAETSVAYGPAAGSGLRAQNVTYAIQWVLFALCVVYFWWRLLRDDLNDQSQRNDGMQEPLLERPAGEGPATSQYGASQVTQSEPDPTRKKVY